MSLFSTWLNIRREGFTKLQQQSDSTKDFGWGGGGGVRENVKSKMTYTCPQLQLRISFSSCSIKFNMSHRVTRSTHLHSSFCFAQNSSGCEQDLVTCSTKSLKSTPSPISPKLLLLCTTTSQHLPPFQLGFHQYRYKALLGEPVRL